MASGDEYESGWIGGWSPGIGDPTPLGWFTVVLYGLATWCAYRLATKRARLLPPSELWFWRVLAGSLAALGGDKELDLQSALTEFGRLLALEHGWYERRGEAQRLFIGAVVLGSLLVGASVTFLLRRAPSATWTTIAGAFGLLGFVAIRAASFHHFDAWLGGTVDGLRWNWVLEIGSLFVVLAGTLVRFFGLRTPAVVVVRASRSRGSSASHR